MLHAGVIHLVSNVFIQLRVGGYLNLVFGTRNWLIIYILSGVFGNMCSCVLLTDAIGVGSSGALLGMLLISRLNGRSYVVYLCSFYRNPHCMDCMDRLSLE